MTVWSSTARDLYLAGDLQVAIRPKNYRATAKPAIIYCHGRGGTAADALGASQPVGLLAALADKGYPVLSIDASGSTTWGKDAAINAVGTAVTWARANLGANNSPVVLIGQSMGFLTVAGWAAANLASVAALVGVIPVCDLQDMVTNNRGGYASEINAQYSGGYSNASYGSTHNPQVMASAGKYAGLATRLYYGDSDAVAVPATVSALTTAVGASASSVTLSGGHAGATVNTIDSSDVASFVTAHA